MKLKLLSAIAISALLVGCGGGDGDNSDPKGETVEKGTGYYIDSAVSGITYNCGIFNGKTNEIGAFTFEVGKSCTFYLDEIKLRDVLSKSLVDGKEVFETNFDIAQILQSLDSDGNPANGITINEEIVKLLSEAGITSLPSTEAELIIFLNVIKSSGGIIVSPEDTKEHLMNTILLGNTVYQHCKNDSSNWISSMTFNEDGTIVMIDGDNKEITPFNILGDSLITIEDDGTEENHLLSEITSEYILFGDDKFYFTEELAQNSDAITCIDEETIINPFSEAVAGKTLYINTAIITTGEDARRLYSWSFDINMESMIIVNLNSQEIVSGDIIIDGMNMTYPAGEGTRSAEILEVNNEYIIVLLVGRTDSLRLYFDEQSARDYYNPAI